LIYRFEDFSLDGDRRELRRGSEIVAIEPQVFDVLEFLIANRERVVSNDGLIQAVWQGRIVSDGTVSTRINAVRHALGDSGAHQRLIRTLPRKGASPALSAPSPATASRVISPHRSPMFR
jgi:DNA-binding winged helix-turn-helix (wHTH) protein